MKFPYILLISIGLAMDAFSVALGVGSSRRAVGGRAFFRLSFHFGLFQFMMPVIGWYSGFLIEPFVSSIDHWIAFFLLAYVGGKMIYEGFLTNEMAGKQDDPTRGKSLIFLSIATSIDALSIGFSLGLVKVDIWFPSVVIGIITGILSLIGLVSGRMLGNKFGKKMEIVGGMILCLMALKILLIDHLKLL